MAEHAPIADVETRRAALAAFHPMWTPKTLCGAFDDAAERHPDRACFTNDQGSWTYRAMQVWSRQLGRGLIAWGLRPGEHVALLMANYAEFVALKLAIARAGAVTIPINFNLRGDELRYVIDQSDAVLLVTMDAFRGLDYIADLDGFAPGWRLGRAEQLPTLREAFIFPSSGVAITGGRGVEELAALGDESDRALLAEREAAGDPDGICDILYTSGTTGRPKGVMLSHDNVLRAAYASALHRAFEDGRTFVHALPMYHVFGYVECLVASWFVGGHTVSQLTFEAAGFLDLSERHRASDLACLPNMTLKLLEIIPTRGFDPTGLIAVFNSGGVNPPTIWREIRNLLRPAEIHSGYGMSETTASTVCSLPEGEDARLINSNGCYKIAGAAGTAAAGGWTALYQVVDPETGAGLPAGEIGELLVRGPVVTRGYYRKPEETAAAFTAGWLYTGDLGRISADGYLTLTGRLKESYRCGGEMVMPREIEALFDDDPEVVLALAVGVPDARMGDVGCLCIVPRNGATPDRDALIARCAANLARFKVPRHLLFLDIDEVPMTSTGRPQKVRLVAIAAERIAAAAQPVSARL